MKSSRPAKPHRQWIELIPLILLLVVPSCERVDGDIGRGAVLQIASFKTALDGFQEDCGRFPSTSEGLTSLVKCPTSISQQKWRGPYLDAIPADPWGREYVYLSPGKHNTNTFDLYSLGEDGASNSGGQDPDDIASWSRRRLQP